MSFGFGFGFPKSGVVAANGVPGGGSTLRLNFLDSTTLDPRITFSRTSNATQFDSSGALVYAPHNLLTFSEQFDNAAWGKTNGTVSANSVAAPNGTTTADVLIADATNAEHVFDQAFTAVAGNTYTVSAHFRSNGLTDVGLRFTVGGLWPGGAAPQVRFNLANGTTTVVGGSPSSSSIQDIGGGWFRCSMSAACVVGGSSGARVQLMSGGNNVFAGNGVNGIAAWGAQLNIGTLQPYNTTTVKNLLGYSQEFDNAAWTKTNSFVQTNQIRNNTMQGAVAGTPGTAPTNWFIFTTLTGLTQQIVGTGVDAGINYIDIRTSGTPSSAGTIAYGFEGNTSVAASNGQTWTESAYLKVQSGSLGATQVRLQNDERSATTYLRSNASLPFSVTSAELSAQRFSLTSLLSGGATVAYIVPYLQLTLTGVAVDFTLRIGWPQLVQGAVAGDPVATYGTARAVMYPAPDGSVTGDKWVENVGAGAKQLFQTVNWLNGTRSAWSIYAKAAERGFLYFSSSATVFPSGGVLGYVNLNTGATSGVGANCTITATSVGNGWWRCCLIATPGATATNPGIDIRISANGSDAGSYTGDGTSGILIWGAQLSDSASLDPYVYNPLAAPTAAAYYGPRFDYDPFTLAPLGLLIEEQRTNSIRNNSMVGAVAGTPGTLPTNWVQATLSSGLTQQVVGVGTDGGINYIDIRLFGTTADANGYSLNFEAATQIAAANGQSWTASLYLAIVSGSTANITSIAQRLTERSAAGAFLAATDVSITATSSLKNRFFTTRTFNNASTAFTTSALVLNIASGVAIDITLRIGLPQLELGAFATSVIPTTTAAATRTADVATMVGANFSNWYNASEGALFAEFTRGYTGNFANFTSPAIITSNVFGANANSIASVVTNGANQQLYNSMAVNNVEQLSYQQELAQITNKAALAYKTNDTQQFINSVAKTTDTSCTVPTSVSQMNIGTGAANVTFINSYIRRITYYPRRLSQAEGVGITL